MTRIVSESWSITKPAVSGNQGLVSSQHYLASEAGAEVLRRGGNAIDAAIAAGLVLGTVEPWMSGIGGGGYMTVHLAAEKRVRVVDFGMRAPLAASADDYPLVGSGVNASDAFNWPAVEGDANVEGPLSIAVPGYIRGMALALSQFGSWSWTDVIEPACQQAEQGLPIDWFSAQKVNQWARALRRYDETRRVYLADGLPPAADLDARLTRLPLGNLASTYRRLQTAGPEDFYTGELAGSLCRDLSAAGSRITLNDLRDYEAQIVDPLTTEYRGHQLSVSGDLTAGPSIIHALGHLSSNLAPADAPDSETYKRYANALLASYEHRLSQLGEGNTSHLCVADAEGNVVSLTQTIMSAFGSRVMLPESGVLMNNGMMWFDPRPGGPNSVVGGRRPLCNMCPVILQSPDGAVTAIGACGGRKIFPAVFQLTSFLADYGMTVEQAAHTPRLDVSGTSRITLMDSLPESIQTDMQGAFDDVAVRPHGVSPNLFALPQLIRREADGTAMGGCFVPSPHARVVAP